MNKDKIAIAITAEAEELLQPILDMFKTQTWSNDHPKPICLMCEFVDFSGHLIEAHVLDSSGKFSTRLWIPHHYVLLSVDFSSKQRVGFHGAS